MSNFLDDTHSSNDEVLECSYEISSIADAFYKTGNEILAEKLDYISRRLDEAQKKNRGAVGKEIHDRANAAHQSSAEMINACLGGMTISSPQAL